MALPMKGDALISMPFWHNRTMKWTLLRGWIFYKQVDKLYIDAYCALVPLFLNPRYQAVSADAGF
jgi:hypothetical protein